MWITDGQLYSAGCPQYGQLGHGSTHEYNTKDSSVKMAFEPQPTPNPIQAFVGKQITKVAHFVSSVLPEPSFAHICTRACLRTPGHCLHHSQPQPQPCFAD
jgi:hypothetical protein